MKLLSIAIPCYNSEKYMRKCIDSLLIGGEDVEILIIDDGSTKDRTAEIADEYEGKVKGCKLDVDLAMDFAMSYGVASITTLILFKDGEIVKKSVGVVSKTEIEAMWS